MNDLNALDNCQAGTACVQRLVMPRPDCCDEWARSAWRLNVAVMSHCGMVSKPDDLVRFCPWCGRARHNV